MINYPCLIVFHNAVPCPVSRVPFDIDGALDSIFILSPELHITTRIDVEKEMMNLLNTQVEDDSIVTPKMKL